MSEEEQQNLKAPDPTADWETFSNTKYGYTFKYPKLWIINRGPGNLTNEKLAKGRSINIYSSQPVTLDDPGTSFIIETNELHPKGDEKNCSDLENCINLVTTQFPSKATRSNETFQENRAVRITYIRKTDNYSQTRTHLFTILKGDFYNFYLFTKTSRFEQDNKTFNQTLSTFKFLPEHCGSCPQFMPPVEGWCKDGTIIPSSIDECSCQGPPRCELTIKTNTLSYKLPTGWKATADRSRVFEVAYDPKKSKPASNLLTDLFIDILKVGIPGPNQGYSFYITLTTYSGGSKHQFIYDQLGTTNPTSNSLDNYSEREYTYNGKSCLVLYNFVVSQSGATNGMCDSENGKAYFFSIQTNSPELTERIIQTIKLL